MKEIRAVYVKRNYTRYLLFGSLYFWDILMNESATIEDKQKPDQSQSAAFAPVEITIKGAREHNLNNVTVKIPKNKLVVVTGVSGSGKSSLIMDTLYAEGQRRYVESLSSYARQFLTRMEKPDIDYIEGLCPAIAIEQKVTTRTSRSTVGSLTEIYDYLKLLFARAGRTLSPISGNPVKKHEVADVVDFILSRPVNSKVQLLAPLHGHKGRSIPDELDLLLQKGFSRVVVNNHLLRIEDLEKTAVSNLSKDDIFILVDRYVIKPAMQQQAKRIGDSVQTALFESEGVCWIDVLGDERYTFSNKFELDGMIFEEPTPELFSYNNPYGACKRCEGFGSIIGIDEDLVFPNKNLSVYDDAIACWRGEKMQEWKHQLVRQAIQFDFPVHRSIKDLTEAEYQLLWDGNHYFSGLHSFFEYLEEKSYKIQYRVMLSRYRGRTTCPECRGTRIRKDANYVKLDDRSITELLQMPVDELYDFFQQLSLDEYQLKVAQRILTEVNNRLRVMLDVGLGYLSLNRLSNTLSGGETQRINLTRTLGSNLTSSLYILDEPSIGLHPKDTDRLILVLKQLRDLGNTVIVVEHEEEIMRAADYIIDMGPEAGIHGGDVVAQGNYAELMQQNSLTKKYLTGELSIPVPQNRRRKDYELILEGARQHNLKDVTAHFPLQAMTVVTGVSGSGKTTLIKKILFPALQQLLHASGEKPGLFSALKGDIDKIDSVEMIDQNPIGKSSRSNPVTYVKAFDAIRDLFARQQQAKIKGLKPKHFSFNVEGGRCETCKGEGEVTIEMQFLADIHLTCEACGGKRFKQEVLEVTYNGNSIFDVLELSVEEALSFFKKHKDIVTKLQPLYDVGLGYIKLGQSSSTLSGGEAQRVKLAFFLSKGRNSSKHLFIFDEPTTGLHFHDIQKLIMAFNALIANGHSIIVIEHDPDVIKCADWVIDLGPEGGKGGGHLVFEGTPEELVNVPSSATAQYLKTKLA